MLFDIVKQEIARRAAGIRAHRRFPRKLILAPRPRLINNHTGIKQHLTRARERKKSELLISFHREPRQTAEVLISINVFFRAENQKSRHAV